MPTYAAAASIRNVAVVGHNGSGKTQLISALLFTAGAATRLGRVDDGTAPTDFDEEAIARKHTLAATPAWLDWQGSKVNLVDTPGFGNFLSETGASLRVTDAALVVVDAVAGVEVQTERVWALAGDEHLARFVVVNRLDRERASFATALDDLQSAFGRTLVPVQLPYGEEKGFRGVIDLIAQRAYTYEGGTGRGKPVAIPESLAAEARNAREALVELVAEADDELMSRFFDEGTLTDEELVAGLRHGRPQGRRRPRVLRVRRGEHRRRPPARGPGPVRALSGRSACRRRRTVQRRDRVGDRRRERPDAPVHLEDRGRSLRRPHLAVPGRHRRGAQRHHAHQPDARVAGAHSPPAGPAGQDAVTGQRTARGRPRRHRQAQGRPDGRHALGQGRRPQLPADRVRASR